MMRFRAKHDETDPLLGAERGMSSAAPSKRRTRGERATMWVFGVCLAFACAFTHSYFVAPHSLIRMFNVYVLGKPTREITFRVYTCGIPDEIYAKFLPWPICRAKLVGCPGHGATCGHWRYANQLEMPATSIDRNVFEIKTRAFGTGDVYGFAAIEAGCTLEHERECQKGSHADCKLVGRGGTEDRCDHRYDAGTHHAENHGLLQSNTTCWHGGERCSSASPAWYPIKSHRPGSRHCFKAFGDKWYNRVVPPGRSGSVITYVWGTCMKAPQNPEACANRNLPNVCTMLEKTQEEPIEEPAMCGQVLSDDTTTPDGKVFRIKHNKPGIKSMSAEGSCCNGEPCPVGNMCTFDPENKQNKQARTCKPMESALPEGAGICANPWFPQAYGVCTQSCGSGNADCDETCAAAQAAGYELSCDPIAGEGANKCRCNNVGGHTANECQNSANPGYKCCTCMDIVGLPKTNNGNGGNSENAPGQQSSSFI